MNKFRGEVPSLALTIHLLRLHTLYTAISLLSPANSELIITLYKLTAEFHSQLLVTFHLLTASFIPHHELRITAPQTVHIAKVCESFKNRLDLSEKDGKI